MHKVVVESKQRLNMTSIHFNIMWRRNVENTVPCGVLMLLNNHSDVQFMVTVVPLFVEVSLNYSVIRL